MARVSSSDKEARAYCQSSARSMEVVRWLADHIPDPTAVPHSNLNLKLKVI